MKLGTHWRVESVFQLTLQQIAACSHVSSHGDSYGLLLASLGKGLVRNFSGVSGFCTSLTLASHISMSQ